MKNLLSGLLLFPFLMFSQIGYDQAERYFQKGEFDSAKTLFQEYLSHNPNDKKTREYLGDIAGHSKEWDTAIMYYKGLRDENINSANYNFKYGGALGMKALEVNQFVALTYIGDIKEALENAARLDSKHIEVRWALVEFYMKLPSIIGGSEMKATKYANELVKISPVDGYLTKGLIAEYSKEFEEAEKYFKKAIDIGKSPLCYEMLRNLYEKNDEHEKAKEISDKLLELRKI